MREPVANGTQVNPRANFLFLNTKLESEALTCNPKKQKEIMKHLNNN